MRAFSAIPLVRTYMRANYLVPAALVASTFAIVAIAGLMQSHAGHKPSNVAAEAATEVAPATQAALTGNKIAVSPTVPAPAMRAYQEAASAVDTASAEQVGCNIDWTLLAGLGAVVSDHGRDEGRLSAKGGQPKGPFQFTASIWDVYGADGNGDKARNVEDIDDSALAAALFLCATGKNLATESGTHAALESFNRDPDFVSLVLSAAATYKKGETAPAETVESGDDSDLEVVCRDEIGAAKIDLDDLDQMVMLCTQSVAGKNVTEAKAEIQSLVATLS